MSGYQRSDKTADVKGINSGFSPKKKHEYVDKMKMDDYYIVLLPEVEGYLPDTFAYHIEIASIKIKGKEKIWNPRGLCLGENCQKCIDNRARFKKDRDTPFKKRRQVGQLFMTYLVYPNKADGTFRFGSKKDPLLCEYWFSYDKLKRKMVCADWENLMDAYEKALGDNRDPLDPTNAVIFHVKRDTEPFSDGTGKKVVFRHTYLAGKTIALPEDWRETIEKYYTLDELYHNFSGEDLKILVDTSTRIEKLSEPVENEAPDQRTRRLGAIDKVYENYGKISKVDFRRILENMEKVGDNNQRDKNQKTAPGGGSAAPSRSGGSQPGQNSSPRQPERTETRTPQPNVAHYGEENPFEIDDGLLSAPPEGASKPKESTPPAPKVETKTQTLGEARPAQVSDETTKAKAAANGEAMAAIAKEAKESPVQASKPEALASEEVSTVEASTAPGKISSDTSAKLAGIREKIAAAQKAKAAAGGGGQ